MGKKIAIDAGHSEKTAGKQTPDGIKEWTLNDKVRDKIVEFLKDYDVEFIFPDNDEGVVDEGLTKRRTMYINERVDAAVSIHHNAYSDSGKWNNATGVEVFTDNNPIGGDTLLAECIYKRLPEYTGLKGRGIKKANWTVINQNAVPAVLVEGGFMDSRKDYKVITSDAGQTGYAKAVAEGLIEFLKLEKKKTSSKTKTPTAKVKKTVTATGTADHYNKALVGTYTTTANLHLRNDAGSGNKSLCVIPKGTKVKCYGYYSLSAGVNWLYIQVTLNGVQYTGFSSKGYLKK